MDITIQMQIGEIMQWRIEKFIENILGQENVQQFVSF